MYYVERWYRTFKQRTRRFYNNFPIKDPVGAIERIDKFLHLFAYWYNHITYWYNHLIHLGLSIRESDYAVIGNARVF